ncbi:hypothetical protein MPTK1_6g17850 [Marchantia polymorpha subsp. ruderalis]|uniref:Uncharacterized protein n=2 Tax=Marchantia polymorpha TaxID=3197 RepID=A0A176W3K0_MARPO|nr:hypothetical protein AXG93_2520s1000 [Marchantia polymorpha subsp. ruderalis]PTQ29233.1 hypothetical protein MARPO_0145s0002 [Marchantia polymorpha]PTQ29234.1 hypothetical protein MARPO_0145s0002 [Marchantia polymorpha]BBN15200.1 hypothetical protein Mp_6g17850 [Marchantia polymorpha subsp. ruderalis]BBN15201.1 hypothetical protein Mp_6g17850 [Marchantia polymorpha subsp. ruderalis]|eukprot:PTQ29233.1 hypothetical protein MARPO_0145s0002 [Marchantia polymorpha]
MAKTKQSVLAKQCQRWRDSGNLEKLRAFEEAYKKSKMEAKRMARIQKANEKKNTTQTRGKGKTTSGVPFHWKKRIVSNDSTSSQVIVHQISDHTHNSGETVEMEKAITCDNALKSVEAAELQITKTLDHSGRESEHPRNSPKDIASSSTKEERLFWSDQDSLQLIMAIKSEKENVEQKRAYDSKVSKMLDWRKIAAVINPKRADVDDKFVKKCLHKFDELKRHNKKKCPDGCDLMNYLVDVYTKRMEGS